MVRGALALAVVLALSVGAYLYFHLDSETRRAAQAVIGKACDPFITQVGAARFRPGSGLVIRSVRLYDPRTPDVAECVFQADSMRIEGRFDIGSLLSGDPRIERIVIESPQLVLVRQLDGQWNIQDLQLPQGSGGPAPTVEIRGASLQVTDASRPQLEPIVLEQIDATLTPAPEGNGSSMTLVATAAGEFAERIALSGALDPQNELFELEAQVDALAFDDQLIMSFAADLKLSAELIQLSGVASARASVSRRAVGAPIDWGVAYAVNQGVIQVRSFPGPVSNVELEGECNAEGLAIHRASAQWGSSSLRLACNRTGWSSTAPITLRAKVDSLNTKELPIAQLPAGAQKFWRRFRPEGVANVALEAYFDGRGWRPRATATFQNGSFEDAEKFRYRLTQGSGRIDLNGGIAKDSSFQQQRPAPDEPNIRVDLTALAEGTPVRIAASLNRLDMKPAPEKRRPMPLGWIEVSGVGIPVTQRLVEALPDEGAKKFLYSLRPSGRVDLRWRADREDPAIHHPKTSLDVRLINWNVNYDKFPYPLSSVSGWVRQRGKRWIFNELKGRGPSGATVITASGELVPQGQANRLVVRFDGSNVPLDRALWDALTPDVRQAWEYLSPRGEVDFTAIVTNRFGGDLPQNAPPLVDLSLQPQGRVAIAPMLSPKGNRYELDQLHGTFDWKDDQLTITAARAVHGPTRFATDGAWEKQANGGWRLVLNGLYAQRVEFDEAFRQSAPEGLVSVIDALEPSGRLELYDSSLLVEADSMRDATASARWDLGVQCHQASFNAGALLEGMTGHVRLVGSTDGVAAETTGEIALDSVFWNDLQLTQVRGPLWATGEECLIGEGVARKVKSTPRRLTARAYDGAIEINSHIKHDARESYGLSVQLAGVNVSRLASEWMQRPEAIGGQLEGRLEFEGSGSSIDGLIGRGALTINNADLYQLPILIRLLKVLRNRTPDETAFDRCEAQFTQQGEQLQFQQLDLLGDAVSLYGRGSATLSKQVELTFGALVGRNELAVPMFKAFVSSASEQLMRLHVTGSLDMPEVRREALPIVGNVLDQFGPAAARPPSGVTK